MSKKLYRSKKFMGQDIEAAVAEYGGKIEQIPMEGHEPPKKEWGGILFVSNWRSKWLRNGDRSAYPFRPIHAQIPPKDADLRHRGGA